MAVYLMMISSSIRAFPLVIILISSLLIPTAFSEYLQADCSGSATRIYSENLQNLLACLYNNTPTSGFGMCSSGQITDRIFGLSLCRGSDTTEDCLSCIKEASTVLTNGCPFNRSGIIWYDYCYLKYSDYNFTGQIDTENKIEIWTMDNDNDNDTSKPPWGFQEAAIGLLRNVSRNAADTNNTNMFAGEEILFGENKNVTIYGMAQCSRDLSKGNCQICLDGIVKDIHDNSYWENSFPIGVKTLTGSCNARYDIHPFLN